MKHRFLALCLAASLITFGTCLPGISAAQISKQEAAAIAESRFKGRIIAIKQKGEKDTLVYKVKILDSSGGMHIVIVNGQDGQIISAH